jgi:glyoxylase-like metal-dependent hydrolase (beta-lactamase superfamily II)
MKERTAPPAGVHQLSLPTPYPVGRSNAYLLEGDPPVLVDCGVKSSRATGELEAGLGERGVRIGDLGAILLTHPHFDHAGAAADIARRTGVGVYGHRFGLEYEFRGRAAFYRVMAQYGAPTPLVATLEAMNDYGERYGEQLTALEELRLLDQGDRFVLGGAALDVLYTPGHNAAHLCFLDRRHAALYCGDLLLAGITPNPLPHFDPQAPGGRLISLNLYLDSLDRVEALGPVIGLAGHGRPLADTAAAARKARRQIHQRAEIVLDLCHEHLGETLFALAGRLFGEEGPLGEALAFSELLAHADRLEASGRIKMDHEGGTVVWAEAPHSA